MAVDGLQVDGGGPLTGEEANDLRVAYGLQCSKVHIDAKTCFNQLIKATLYFDTMLSNGSGCGLAYVWLFLRVRVCVLVIFSCGWGVRVWFWLLFVVLSVWKPYLGGSGNPIWGSGCGFGYFWLFWGSGRGFGYFWLVWGVPVFPNVAKGKQFGWTFQLPHGGRRAHFKRSHVLGQGL